MLLEEDQSLLWRVLKEGHLMYSEEDQWVWS